MSTDPTSSSTDAAVSLASVEAANTALYAAFEALDFRAMEELWDHTADVVCVHPGWEPLSGWPAVRESWRAIIANTGYMRIRPSEVEVQVEGDLGRVLCIENLYTIMGSQAVHSRVAATNLFRRTPEGWRLVLHHGSPISTDATRLPETEPGLS